MSETHYVEASKDITARVWQDPLGDGDAEPWVDYPVEVLVLPESTFIDSDEGVLVLSVTAAKKFRKALKKVIRELEEGGYA